MDLALLSSSVLRAHGFVVSAETLTVSGDRLIMLDFHPRNILLYAELDLEHRYAHSVNLNVDPLRRQRGVGSRLLAAHEEICREAELTILINNNKNPAFWKRQGYRRLNPFQEVLLSKRLGIKFRAHSVYKKF